MQLTWNNYRLQLKSPFRIAHGTSIERESVFVNLEGGLGEAAIVPYYAETSNTVIEYLSRLETKNWEVEFLDEILDKLPSGSNAAKTSIDLAMFDLLGKKSGKPLYQLLGVDPQNIPPTSYTLTIDNPETVAHKATELNYPIYKVKLGGKNDWETLAMLRNSTSAVIRVDANAGWNRNQAAELIPKLGQFNLEFIEQPLPVGDIEGLKWLQSLDLGLPIFVDENVRSLEDISTHQGIVDGIVVKLTKFGGIRASLQAIHLAKSYGMKVMVSCMIESSLAVTAAAHIAALCDYVDLDAPLFLKNDPFSGVIYHKAKLSLTDRPGLGIIPAESYYHN